MSRHLALTLFLVSGSTASITPISSAQLLNWANASGGAASLSGNWSPAAVPGSANALVWNLNNAYVTTFNNLTFSSLSHTYKSGTVSLSMTSPHGTGNVVVADLAGDIATARLINGSFNVSGLTLANATSTVGTLEIIGGSSTLTIGGNADAIIGNNGNATLNILNGGQLTVPDQFLAGGNSTSTTTVTISGEEAGVRASTLNVTGTTDSRIGAGGDVTMVVESGGAAAFSGNVIIANGSASGSNLRIRSTSTSSQVSIAGTLSLGRNISTGVAAGNGSVFVESGGRLTVTGPVNLGNDPDGGSGLFRMSGTSPVAQVGGLNIGVGGTLEIFGGSLTIQGPITVPAGFQLQVPFPGAPASSSPIVDLRTGSSYTSTGATSIGGVAGSTGFLNIRNGTTFHQAGSDFSMGSVAGGSASVVINTGGSLQADAAVVVGGSGSAQLQLLGGSLTCRDMDIARTSNSSGSATISNSTLSVTEDLVVGGASNGVGGFNSGGTGTLIIASGGVVNTPINRGAYISGNGTLTINNGTMNIGSSLVCAGTYTQNGGTINAQSMEFNGAASGRGTINARIFTGSTFILTGALTLGLNTSNAVDRVLMNVGPHTLTCVDSDVAVLADTTIAGGTINAANGLRLFAGETISGFGTINNDFENLGTVTATTAAGITFTGDVVSSTGQLGGTRIHFASGSSYTGRNVTGGAKWHADENTLLSFTGSSSGIGDNTADGVIIRDTLDVASTVTFFDTGGLQLGRLTMLRNGTIQSFNNLLTVERNSGGGRHTLMGTGTINAALSVSGTISPALPTGDRTTTLTIGGFYSQSVAGDTGQLIINVDGTSSTAHDILQLNGGGAVDGLLTVAVGYTPANGDRVSIIRRGGTNTLLVGTFDQLVAPLGWALDYRADSIDLVFCASDYNADGIGDFFDYLDFVADFSSGDPRADFNLDSVIDFFDYLDFVAAFSSGC